MTSPLWGEFIGHRWIPLTKASHAELCSFVDLRRNKRLSEKSRRRWFETPSLRWKLLCGLLTMLKISINYSSFSIILLKCFSDWLPKKWVLILNDTRNLGTITSILTNHICAQSRNHADYLLSQWETMLHCNVFSHWLSPYPEWPLQRGNVCHCYDWDSSIWR